MKLYRINATLSHRDASLTEIRKRRDNIIETELASVLPDVVERVEEGNYESLQGPTITPSPVWIVEVRAFRRNIGGTIQEGPKITSGKVAVASSRRASKVTGTGAEKAKWRDTTIEGEVQSRYLFTVATSTWLVPFAIGHRFLAALPASEDAEGKLQVHHDLAQRATQSLRGFASATGGPSSEIRKWVREAQRIWSENKKDASAEFVTKWLDYASKLSSVDWSRPRVIHTRSRTFYAALLQPEETTALGLPINKIRLVTRQDAVPLTSTDTPAGGSIVDNKVHHIEVANETEGYWLTMVLNSEAVTNEIMSRSKGEPPNIYSIPAQVLADFRLKYDPRNSTHQSIARIGRKLTMQMRSEVKAYLVESRGIDPALVDDSELSPEVPSLIATRFMKWMREHEDWKETSDEVVRLIRRRA